jgi:hypothetical protein
MLTVQIIGVSDEITMDCGGQVDSEFHRLVIRNGGKLELVDLSQSQL